MPLVQQIQQDLQSNKGWLSDSPTPRRPPPPVDTNSLWALAPVIIALAGVPDAPPHRPPPPQPAETWTQPPVALPPVPVDARAQGVSSRRFEVEPWVETALTGSATPQATDVQKPPLHSPRIDEPWELAPIVVTPVLAPSFDAAPVLPTAVRARRVDEPWAQPTATISGAPWESEPPRPPPVHVPRIDEPWSQAPINLGRFDADRPERSSYRLPHQRDFEPWSLTAISLGRQDVSNPERPTYRPPRQPDELWTLAPIVLGRFDADRPERSSYVKPRPIDEPWAQPAVKESASPWIEQQNPERPGYTKPRAVDEPWTEPAVETSAAPWSVADPRPLTPRAPRLDEAWSQPPVREPWIESNPERNAYHPPRQPDELWSAPSARISATPWVAEPPRPATVRSPRVDEPWILPPIALGRFEAPLPEQSGYRKPHQPDELWSQKPITLGRWDTSNPERSTYQKPRPIDEPWSMPVFAVPLATSFDATPAQPVTPRAPRVDESWSEPPVRASAAPWASTEPRSASTRAPRIDEPWSTPPIVLGRWDASQPERSGYIKPRPIDEPWTQPPVEVSASPWEEVANPERNSYRPPRQPDEPWSQPSARESAAPWSTENPRSPAVRAPRVDEAWSQDPISLARQDATVPERSSYSKPRPIDELWSDPAVKTSAAPWAAPQPERSAYHPPRQPDELWTEPPVRASAGPWATDNPRPAPVHPPRVDELWSQQPIALGRWDAAQPERSTYQKPRQPDELWSQPAVRESAAPWEEVENPEHSNYKLPRQPDELWTEPPVRTSAAPWAADPPRLASVHAPRVDELWTEPPVRTACIEPSSERSTYKPPRQPDELWAQPPAKESPADWEEIGNPERNAYTKPRPIDEPWSEPPVGTSAAPWATNDPRASAARVANVDEPWAQPAVEVDVGVWEEVANPERSGYKPPRQPDETWSADPVALSAAPWAVDLIWHLKADVHRLRLPDPAAIVLDPLSAEWNIEATQHQPVYRRRQDLNDPWTSTTFMPPLPPVALPAPPSADVRPPGQFIPQSSLIRRWISRGWFAAAAVEEHEERSTVSISTISSAAVSPIAEEVEARLTEAEQDEIERALIDDELDSD